MLATIMQVLDTTIANVALPHMRGSARRLAERDHLGPHLLYRRRRHRHAADRLALRPVRAQGTAADAAVVGFTVTSLLCGIATSLEEMVLFRVLQGICGAMIVPLAQAILLDINPREKLGQAMAIFGAGIMVGPIIGPTLGGWLTETFNWRAVFLVNLPVGILAFFMLSVFMPHEDNQAPASSTSSASACWRCRSAPLQMLLDRGAEIGWFDAVETWIYLGLCHLRAVGVHRPLPDRREPVRRLADVQATATSAWAYCSSS